MNNSFQSTVLEPSGPATFLYLDPDKPEPAQVLGNNQRNLQECDSKTIKRHLKAFLLSSAARSDHWHASCCQSHCAGTLPGTVQALEETDMNKLTIKDLTVNKQLDKRRMTSLSGGIGRTPPQIRVGHVGPTCNVAGSGIGGPHGPE